MDNDGSGLLLVHMIAGCVAGAIEATATWPMEYIKTQLQLQKQPQQRQRAKKKSDSVVLPLDGKTLEDTLIITEHEGIAISDSYIEVFGETRNGDSDSIMKDRPPQQVTPPLFTNMTTGIIHTVKTHGFFALYYGLTPTLIGSIPKAGIRFGLFAWFSALLRDSNDGTLSIGMCFLAGLMAGAIEAVLVVVPIETIKTKCIQLNMPFLQGLQEIVRLEGIRGIYNGVLATVWKQSSNHGLRFVWYYEYKRFVTHNGVDPYTPGLAFIGGMTAGIFSTLGNQPVDVIKTKLQGLHVEYSSTWDCIRQIFVTEGFPGFYTGIIPRLFRVIPGQGIIFMSFEIIVSILMATIDKF
ncbi:MAG: hypothetical protein SGARI_003304 [Bacillariaceae sp.]